MQLMQQPYDQQGIQPLRTTTIWERAQTTADAGTTGIAFNRYSSRSGSGRTPTNSLLPTSCSDTMKTIIKEENPGMILGMNA
jgi:hypothetical protein